MISHRLFLVTIGLLAGGPTRAADSNTAPPPSPAQVTNPIKETDLTTVRLEPSAESRLGIVAVPVEMKRVHRERLFGGTVVLPLAVIGQEDQEGEAHPLRFAPDPPASTTEVLKLAEMQAQADGAIDQAKVQMNAGRIALKRAETLLETETGSQRGVDEARTMVELAETALQQARLRRSLLGTPVHEAAALDQVWLKVPVYVGDLAKLDSSRDARMGHPGDGPGRPTRAARFVTGPPSANPSAATVDWFYEVSNPGHILRLGQRVAVWLPLQGEAESLVVPWAAILHDVHGGQWVYEATAPQTYVRRRVQVARVAGHDAVLAMGPKPGVKVVTDGAAELFGTEFGPGK